MMTRSNRIVFGVVTVGVAALWLSAMKAADDAPPAGAPREFSTDFTLRAVPFDEILSGGPPKDGIPALDAPTFVSVPAADEWLTPGEPVILFEQGHDARAYPLQILMWHEIVNDVVNDIPVLITFCPLCNTAVAFERAIDGQVLDFGTTGRLRHSNLIMYDRQTESWWQQATGEAIIGALTGQQLRLLPAMIVSWQEFQRAYPTGRVLSRDTGYARQYGQNPYVGYDHVNNSPFLFQGALDGRLLPMARVVTVDLNGEAVAYPYEVLERAGVVNDTVGAIPIAVFWQSGTASALDRNTLAAGRDVGAVNTYARNLNGQTLTFDLRDGRFVDQQTHSEWTLVGKAISGPLRGQQLTPVVNINHFWFSWAAFKPETRIHALEKAIE
jgi:hypothetical protein